MFNLNPASDTLAIMSIKEVWTILSVAYWVNKGLCDDNNRYSNCWLLLHKYKLSSTLLQCSKIESDRSVNNFQFYIIELQGDVWSHSFLMKCWAAIQGNNDYDNMYRQAVRVAASGTWHVQGRVMAILYGRLVTRLRPLAIILPYTYTYTITRVHVGNRIHPITIYIGTQPEAGVRGLTLLSLFQ